MKISNKFDSPSVYDNGKYYFPQDKSELIKQDGFLVATIQTVYYSYKWFQDTHYIEPIYFLDLLTYWVKNVKNNY